MSKFRVQVPMLPLLYNAAERCMAKRLARKAGIVGSNPTSAPFLVDFLEREVRIMTDKI